jgi:hypothetical protein
MRRSSEAIEVRCRAGVPVRFRRPPIDEVRTGRRFRGPRWYAVRAVLGFWIESGAWWRSAAARSVLALDADAPAGGVATTSATTSGAGSGAGDRVVWRVEARPVIGQSGAVGVYELVHGIDGGWSLARTAD